MKMRLLFLMVGLLVYQSGFARVFFPKSHQRMINVSQLILDDASATFGQNSPEVSFIKQVSNIVGTALVEIASGGYLDNVKGSTGATLTEQNEPKQSLEYKLILTPERHVHIVYTVTAQQSGKDGAGSKVKRPSREVDTKQFFTEKDLIQR